MVAASAVMENDNKMICKMGIVVDGRRRLSSGDEDKSAVMASYFGNVLSIPFGEKMIDELKEKPLSWVADAVHEYLEGAVTKEHFLASSTGAEIRSVKGGFGWGRPALGSFHFPWGGEAGYVMPMPSPARDGDWVVYMHLLKGQIEFIETEAAHVFRPVTSEYLNLIN
ncbi:hypothetical protein CK203_096379 [Vitis vinifera]|uniref:Shikimate O-hydroxycinnamoyltransferase n=1 Tax=Vitis vinifera TaxID=29760 RepID=A0A438FIE2_VITVI|nr:hypothetical protein CK203_096379 [Vitis vinifera]